jgi:hypothetical protein
MVVQCTVSLEDRIRLSAAWEPPLPEKPRKRHILSANSKIYKNLKEWFALSSEIHNLVALSVSLCISKQVLRHAFAYFSGGGILQP